MRLFDPSDSAYHTVIATWIIADLAEAATHLDRIDEARARLWRKSKPALEANRQPGSH